jgi:dynactin complex subunit
MNRVHEMYTEVFQLKELMSSTERKISQKLDSFQNKVAFLDDRDALCTVYDIENEGQDFSAPNQQKSFKNDQSKSQRHKLALQEKTVQDEQLKKLKGDLNMDVEKILEQVSNLEAKFTIELARLRREAKDMKDTVRSTGDRVIASLDGPWATISDKVGIFFFYLFQFTMVILDFT